MKRLLLAVALVLLPAALAAQIADRDVLLTPDGTLYTIESRVNDGAAPAEVTRYLALTEQRPDEKPRTLLVPGSLSAGVHWRPALAYDGDSRTLFLFWLKMPNAMSSELLLASYAHGEWRPAVSIDNQPYRLRYNLRVSITREISQRQADGSLRDMPLLLVHAVWWEETGYGEAARYALMVVRNGTVNDTLLYELNDFLLPFMAPNEVAPDFNREILKHPAFIDNGTQDSIDVIFGDSSTNTFNRVTLKPVADGRIHIPIGYRPGGPIRAPRVFSADWPGRISTITSPHDDSLLLYNTETDSVQYILYSKGAWSSVKSLPLTDKFSADAAAAALVKMMSQ